MGATSHLVMIPAFQFYVEKEFNQMLLLTDSWLLWAILILPFKRSPVTAQSLRYIQSRTKGGSQFHSGHP